MNGTLLKERIADRVRSGGRLSGSDALREDLAGLRLFDEPAFAAADAGDPLFARLKEPAVVGSHHCLPGDWTPGAKYVLSVFLPFSRRVKDANALLPGWPAAEWLHGRIEGQKLISALAGEAAALMREAGFAAAAPVADGRFRAYEAMDGEAAGEAAGLKYTSNWSERHVAFICGHGAFGLSKGLITEKGVAGRFFSLVTDMEMEVTPRRYTDIYAYCIRCGRCAALCPARAISLESGKDHRACAAFLAETKRRYAPRYGCGKCQTDVPCESGIPPAAFNQNHKEGHGIFCIE